MTPPTQADRRVVLNAGGRPPGRTLLQRLRAHAPLLAILVVAAGLRLLYVDRPLLDAHRWRQVDTAQIARSFYEDRFNVLLPQVNWGGAEGYVESEFPLLPAIVASLYFVTGPEETVGRLVVIAFSLLAIWLTFLLARDLLGHPAGLAAAAVVALSPAAVYYGRAFMPDTLMVCFSLGALVGFLRYGQGGRPRDLAIGATALALAILVKLPGVLILLPIAAALWTARGWAIVRDRRMWVALAVPVAVSALWYWHAFAIYRDTGLTFGVFGTTKTYPPGVAVGPWTTAFPKWSTIELLTDPGFYRTLLSRSTFLLMPPAGFVLAIVGLLVWRRHPWRLVPDAWLAAMAAFILGAGWGHLGHDYYQLPLVPLYALYAAAVARPLFDAEWIGRHIGGRRWAVPAVWAAVLAVGLLGIMQSGVIERHFRPDSLDLRMLRAGQRARAVTGARDLLVVVDDYGVNSPMLLYYAHRKGWSFDADTATAHTVRGLASKGAAFFVTTRWSHIRRQQPDLVLYLESRRQVPLRNPPADMAVFDLRPGS